MQVSFTPEDIISTVLPRQTRGRTTATIRGIASLESAVAGDLSFLGNAKYRTQVGTTKASVVLLPADFPGEPAHDQVFLLVDNPSVALAKLCSRIEQSLWPKVAPGIHPSAVVASGAIVAPTASIGPLCVIEDGAVVGENTRLDAHVFLGRGVRVGADCWLMARVVVQSECVIGDRVHLQPGVVLGADGFGYEFVAGRHEKIPQIGNVVVENDVEIGANSTVDRARFSRTVIGEGTKIDNLVQIGHNVVIGRHCLLCSQVGVSGSTTIEDYAVLAGQVGVAGHLTIGKGVKAGGQAGINSDVAPGTFINGTPAIDFSLERRLVVLYRKLPELFKRVGSLEEQLKKAFAPAP